MAKKKKYRLHRTGAKPDVMLTLTAEQKARLPNGRIMAIFMWDGLPAVEFHDRDDPYVWFEKTREWRPITVYSTAVSLHMANRSKAA